MPQWSYDPDGQQQKVAQKKGPYQRQTGRQTDLNDQRINIAMEHRSAFAWTSNKPEKDLLVLPVATAEEK